MKHSYKEQINGIREMIKLLNLPVNHKPEPTALNPWYLSNVLNDAASTIASLNLNPDIFKKVSALESKVKELTHEIEQLILNAEEDTLNYSVLEHARKLIFEPK